MKTLYAIYKHQNIKIGGLIVYNHTLLEVVAQEFPTNKDAEDHINTLPAGEYVVMPYYKKL